MALTELVSNLATGQVGSPLSATPYAEETTYPFPVPAGPGSGNGNPIDGTLFNDSDKNGIPDRMRHGFSATGLVTTFGLKEASYNKFNLRSDSWNANSLGPATDQPFILRGLQKSGETEPQYWGGFADTLSDTPRGGISAFIERDVVDKVRIGKFLLSPKGIQYQAKQFGLQLMNPNVESFLGVPIPVPAPLTNKFYNPLSPLNQNPLLGVHARRDTVLPVDIGYRYGDIFTLRNVTGLGTRFNRLNLLTQETFGPIGTATGAAIGIAPGMPFLTLTSVTGPKSVFGAGITPISRYTNTSLSQYNLLGPNVEKRLAFIGNPLLGNSDPKKISTELNGLAYHAARYTDLNPYLGLVPAYDPGSDDSIWASPVNPLGNAKLGKIINDPTSFPGNSKVLGKNDNTTTAPVGQRYAAISYGNLGIGTGYYDFRTALDTNSEYKNFSSNPLLPAVNYTENNLVKKYGIPEYGAAGLDRSDPTKSAVTSGDTFGGTTGTNKDLIDFSLTIKGTIYRFRAYISSISNNWSVNSEDGTRFSLAQIVKSKKYTGIDHTIAVDFVVPVLSKAEHALVMAKLDTLAKISYGQPGKNDPNTRRYEYIEPLRIGKFIKTRAVINSLSYDIDNETPWDIDEETPMHVQVSINFTEVADVNNPISSTNNARVIYHP